MFLFVDPGDTSGWAMFTNAGSFIECDQGDFDALCEMLDYVGGNAHTIGYEGYRLRKGKQGQQTGSRFLASQAIGALKLHAHRKGAEVHEITVEAHTLGAMYSGEKPPSNHKESHRVDAKNIGWWWLVKEEIIDAKDLLGVH